MQDLLAESQQIMNELGEENNMTIDTNDGQYEVTGDAEE